MKRPTGSQLPTRSPREILRDLDDADDSSPYIGLRDLMWEIIEDIQSSYRLSMSGGQYREGLEEDVIRDIEADVNDYLANHYGDD